MVDHPNLEWQFHLDCDASDGGKGACLFQIDPETKERRIISWWSKAWGKAMREKPPYYKEAEAMFWGLEKAKAHLLASPLPVFIHAVRCRCVPYIHMYGTSRTSFKHVLLRHFFGDSGVDGLKKNPGDFWGTPLTIWREFPPNNFGGMPP